MLLENSHVYVVYYVRFSTREYSMLRPLILHSVIIPPKNKHYIFPLKDSFTRVVALVDTWFSQILTSNHSCDLNKLNKCFFFSDNSNNFIKIPILQFLILQSVTKLLYSVFFLSNKISYYWQYAYWNFSLKITWDFKIIDKTTSRWTVFVKFWGRYCENFKRFLNYE